ncbi:hypothetical protein GX645_06055 [Candidatus Sumerlaeota bacterium]|nr:hypothetical protein [Candidatus Sumerlaeota bacterium]
MENKQLTPAEDLRAIHEVLDRKLGTISKRLMVIEWIMIAAVVLLFVSGGFSLLSALITFVF